MIAGKPLITRLSQYRNAAHRLKNLGFVRIFSENLADGSGGNAVQVRKDFSMFGIMGAKKGGYQIEKLVEQLDDILGKNKVHQIVVVGSGRIGSALINYAGFEKQGMKIAAAFDVDPAKVDSSGPIPVYPFEQLKEFIEKNAIQIGVISVPDSTAQQVCDVMVQAGIRGILNFAPIVVRAPENCVVDNVNLAVELESVIYFVNAMKKQRPLKGT